MSTLKLGSRSAGLHLQQACNDKPADCKPQHLQPLEAIPERSQVHSLLSVNIATPDIFQVVHRFTPSVNQALEIKLNFTAKNSANLLKTFQLSVGFQPQTSCMQASALAISTTKTSLTVCLKSLPETNYVCQSVCVYCRIITGGTPYLEVSQQRIRLSAKPKTLQ